MEYKLEVVVVPVSDVDRAKHFYAEQMGFVVDVDDRTGLGTMGPGSLQGLQLVVEDIQAARDDLLSRGVPISTIQELPKH